MKMPIARVKLTPLSILAVGIHAVDLLDRKEHCEEHHDGSCFSHVSYDTLNEVLHVLREAHAQTFDAVTNADPDETAEVELMLTQDQLSVITSILAQPGFRDDMEYAKQKSVVASF